MTVEPLSKQRRKRSLILDDLKNKMTSIEQSKKNKDVRSGRSYYEQWDKYATRAEKVLKLRTIWCTFINIYIYILIKKTFYRIYKLFYLKYQQQHL